MQFHFQNQSGNVIAPARRGISVALVQVGLAAAMLTGSSCAAAAAPSAPLLVTRSIVVSAPADKVWKVVGNFGDMSYFSAAVKSTEIVSGRNNQPGAQRRITLKEGGVVVETLTARKERPYRLSYRMDESPLPVSNYRSTISVIPSGQDSKVTWSGQFNSRAAAEDGDQVAVKAITGLYDAGLASIKEVAER
ncbi:SRPBCC family protein [Noviherbaspirillum autotrophicum]|nr:SRPBCC family protein [Noviherbaspirillum autotrophicum]